MTEVVKERKKNVKNWKVKRDNVNDRKLKEKKTLREST
jgi:hypothetical protein